MRKIWTNFKVPVETASIFMFASFKKVKRKNKSGCGTVLN
jgi:hypothetical protein